MDTSKCAECPLVGTTEPLGLTGNLRARFLVVTGVPREEDAARGRSFHPLAQAVFVKQFSRQGFQKQDFSFIPHIRCAHDEKSFTTKDRRAIAKCCREHLRDTIEEIDPETILPLGAEPSSAVFGRAVKIMAVRGSLYDYSNKRSYIYPLISPLQVALYPENTAIFESDIKNLGRLLDNNYDVQGTSLALGDGKFEYIDDLQFLIDQDPQRIAYDTETTSLRWYAPGATILTMQFAIGDGKAYVLPWNHPLDPKRPTDRRKAQLRKQLRQLLCREGVEVLGQNCKFDCVMTAAHAGVKFKIGGDTLMLATLLDENTTMRGLDVLTKRYYPEFAGYCLEGNSKVLLEDGSWESIRKLVNRRYSGNVMSWDGNNIVPKRVIGWHKNSCKQKEWRRIRFEHTAEWLGNPTKYPDGPVLPGTTFTPDHRVYTERGLVEVDSLIPGVDGILTTEKRFSDDQLSVFLGSLLGDGGFTKRHKNGSVGFRFSQRAESRSAYADWKSKCFENLNPALTGYNGREYICPTSRYLTYLEKEFPRCTAEEHGKRKLRFTKKVEESLGLLGLAVWFCDDGSVSGRTGRLSVSGPDVPRMQSWMSALAGEEVRCDKTLTGYCLVLPYSLMARISEFVHPSCQYKLHKSLQGARERIVKQGDAPFYDRVVSVESVKFSGGAHEIRWCISVDETRNFVTKAGVVHNSDHFDKTVDKSRMAEYHLDDQYLLYAGGDAYATFGVEEALYGMVAEDEALLNHYHRVSLPALNMFVGIELRGWHIDTQKFDEFEEFMRREVNEQYEALIRQVPRSILRDNVSGNYDENGVDKGIKFTRSAFIKDILFNHKDGFRLTPKVFTKTTQDLKDEKLKEPSTSAKDHLPFFFEECPFTMDLAQYIKDERMYGTNIVGYKEKYIVDGMVRPQYSLTTAVTGRSASKDPNGQNISKRSPRAVYYRKSFVAPEGYFWVGADLSQAELRLAANYANEKRMLKIYNEGGDIHKFTAAGILGISLKQFDELPKKEKKRARQNAKAVNFGLNIEAPLR